MTKRLGFLVASVMILLAGEAAIVAGQSTFSIQLGPETPVLDLDQRHTLGFSAGPPDGYLGVLHRQGVYTFLVPARSNTGCATPNKQGTYRLGGDLAGLTGDYGCSVSLTDGADGNVEPNGYSFDRDYSGGGPVARVSLNGRSAILMVYHGEWHPGGNCLSVPWFYGSLGLAVSLDEGASFTSLGEIVQPYPTRAEGLGTLPNCHNVHVGYGTLVLADAQGNPLPRHERSNPERGFYYVFYTDSDPTLTTPLGCTGGAYCVAVARARRADVIAAAEAALAGARPTAFPSLFRKYHEGKFSEPATGGDPDDGLNSGHYTPLFARAASQPTVLYDRAIKQFLMVSQFSFTLSIQASPSLLQWSGTPLPNGTIDTSGRLLGYPTLVGEGRNPHVGGSSPYLFYLNTVSSFPDWQSMDATYVSRRIQITTTP